MLMFWWRRISCKSLFTSKREAASSAASFPKEDAAVHDNKQTLTLDGKLYAFADLPPVAHDTLASIQFIEARLQQLRGEMAVSQTAHVAYAR